MALSAKDQQALLASSDPKLAANKKLVWDMRAHVSERPSQDEADNIPAPEYHQHNPNAETGLAGVKAYFSAQKLEAIAGPRPHRGVVSDQVAERDLRLAYLCPRWA